MAGLPSPIRRTPALCLAVAVGRCPALWSTAASDLNPAAPGQLEEVTIIGRSRSRSRNRRFRRPDRLATDPRRVATDINQLLKTVPGTYIREEDGYGLRPNIGIRGATSERSAKITLMEDGVLIAPAPYAAPEAYYFPTLARMQAVEMLKGAAQLRYGPQTTGGVVNLVSTPHPRTQEGRLQLVYGQDHQTDMLASYGGTAWRIWIQSGDRPALQRGFKSLIGPIRTPAIRSRITSQSYPGRASSTR
jgi:outer membrane receptor protein involved in Fe transport